MNLEYVCDMELVYQEVAGLGEKFLLIRPYGGEEGSAYGEGDGTVTGPRLQGTVRWVNHPHRRSDGTMLPDVHGIIRTHDGAMVMFSLQGRTFVEGQTGKQLLFTTFEAEDKRYDWLNHAVCILEGMINNERFSMRARVYACKHELE